VIQNVQFHLSAQVGNEPEKKKIDGKQLSFILPLLKMDPKLLHYSLCIGVENNI
jgi:hypothetical protein